MFIAELKRLLPEADWPLVVAALRSEPQVWAELQDAAFSEQALELASGNSETWSPAFLGLLRQEQTQQFNALRATPMQAVAEKLRYQAAAAFEKLASETNEDHPTPNLAEATLLALALRERRRLLNGWEGSLEVLKSRSQEVGGSGSLATWRLPIVILFGMLPNPQELLAYLVSPYQTLEIQRLGVHALISNPLSLDMQSAHLLEAIRDFPLPQFIALLREIAAVNSSLAQQAAAQAIENLPEAEIGDGNELAEIQRLLLEAEVNQISGQSAQADSLLHLAWKASRKLEVELANQLAEANGIDAESISEIQKSIGTENTGAKSKRPAALLAAAKVAFKSEDIDEAKKMALAALKSATNESGSDSRNGEVLNGLADLFIEMQMSEEALSAAEAAANAQPNNARNVLQLAKLLQENGKAAEALQQAHLAAALDPQNSEARRFLATALSNNHLYEEAFQEWKAMLDNEVEPTVEDWLSFAEAGLKGNHFAETLEACQYALSLQPANGAAYALIGAALVAQGDEGSALAHLRRATELAPVQADAWLELAGLQLAMNDADDALATLISAQQSSAPSARMQQLLGAAYLQIDRDQEALAAYLEAAKLANEESDAEAAQIVALKISALQIQLGFGDAALNTLETAQRAFPNNAEIAAHLGKLLLAINEPKRALSALKQALQAAPENVDLLMDVARAQLAVSEFSADAEQTLEVVLAQKDAPAEAKALMADAKAAQGKHSEAIKAYDAALKTMSVDKAWNKTLMLGKARSQAASGKPVAAIATLEAIDAKGDADVQRELCVSYQLAGRGEEAAQIAQKIYLANPTDEQNILWYADLMDVLGKSALASKALSKSINARNLSPRLILSLAKLQWTGESPQAAQKTLAQLDQLNDGDALALAGKFLLERGAAKESVAFFKRALDLAAPTVEIFENLANAFFQIEQWQNALEALDHALRMAPHKPLLLEQKANALLKLGKPQAALETIETSLQLMPNDVSLLARKAGILREQQDWVAALDAAGKAFALDMSHPGNLLQAAELAVLCLQPDTAREYFTKATVTAKPNLEMACLQAELALDAGLEIEAAKLLSNALDESHARVLAMQSRLAACRGDRSQAAQLLAKALEIIGRQENIETFTSLGVAWAAEKLNEWQAAITLYEIQAKKFRGQPLAQFSLGSAMLLRAEWQQLCDASQANVKLASEAFSKESKAACKQALSTAFAASSDAAAQAIIAGWQMRAEMRFGAKVDIDTLPHNFPATAAEAAALFAAARRSGDMTAFEQRAKAFADAPEVMLEKAIANLDDDIVAALEFVRQAAVVLLQSAPVQALAAHIASKAGELIEALPFVQRALSQWPEQANWQTLAGEIQQALGNLMEAKGHFTTATQLEPKEAKHYYALGNLQVAAHSINDGIKNLQQANKLEPKRAEYSLALAAAFRTAGDNKQAKSFAQQAHKLAPQDPAALLLQVKLAMDAGESQAAKDLAQQALKIAPKDATALSLYAEALHALGASEDAIAVLDRARESVEDEVPLLIRRAELLANGRGLDAMVKLSQRHPDRSDVFFALSQALAKAGSVADAIQAAQRAVKIAGKSISNEQVAGIHLHLGKLLKQSGNLDQSLHHLDQAAKLASHFADSHIERGRLFLARRQNKAALQAFQLAASMAPNDATPHFEMGLALKEAKDFNAAEAELRKAATLAPKDRQIQRQLAGVIALNIVHHPIEAGVAP